MWPNPKLRRSTRIKAGHHAPAPRPIRDPSIITILVGPEELLFRIHEKVLVSLYDLGDYLDAQVVRIAAVDAMILRHEKSGPMTFDDIDFAFANTSPDSKLRSLLVHITTYDLDIGSTAREDLNGMPNEFLVDVSMTLSRRLPNRRCQSCYQSALSWVQQADAVPAHFHEPQDGPPWQTLNTCYYHEHSTEEEERDCAARVAREKVLERREQDRNRS
ncbi:hypothetical protein D6D18_06338 [Aureobasidium pullulans]|nr:hypothetical protein D6D18_06338 [Aureobasidium pullulans]